ncbi:FAD-binding oxidoreductase [Halostreptopolyspora alba]|uniref:FAD-binding oxidoreductase n=1 Tax=Halostreptopolyspora alba TaxID=2487137 RepID=A0A3N0E9R4_9ACTN|nr:FAD-binding oxidoreductase [Nocardiopsaceae bacterium YIM 96095]
MTETTGDLSGEINELAGRVAGPVRLPGSAEYDDERTGYQRRVVHRPAAVVGATDEHDVRAAVEFAAAHGLPIAAQATGHGLGQAMADGVLVTTRRMSGVRVDPKTRTAWVEAGATWRHVIDAAAPHGLAPLSGSAPGVGAVSYTLGGGVGLLARRYGFAADHVGHLELVTVDGRLRRVTPADADLFWALRGGGGNFGVVTAMSVDLVPVTRILGGGLYFDVARTPDALDAWRRWTTTVPEETTSGVTMLRFPDLSGVPEPLRGRHVAQVQLSHLGPVREGERLVAPLRELGPVLDTLRELPYTESGTAFEEPERPAAYRSENRLLADLDPAALTELTRMTGPGASVACVVGLRHLGGALARRPRHPNAVGGRDAAYSLSVLSLVDPGAEEAVRAAHREAVALFEDRGVGRSLNFSFGALDADEVREAFAPADHRRLATLRARYDPHGLLRPAHPIPPVTGDT